MEWTSWAAGTAVAGVRYVSVPTSIIRWGGLRLSRRLSRSLPFFGAFVALGTLGFAMRRKGVARGAVDTALNATPFVGAAKTVVELVRGRDLIPDRAPR
jgi:hypothetical protein